MPADYEKLCEEAERLAAAGAPGDCVKVSAGTVSALARAVRELVAERDMAQRNSEDRERLLRERDAARAAQQEAEQGARTSQALRALADAALKWGDSKADTATQSLAADLELSQAIMRYRSKLDAAPPTGAGK